MKIGEVRIAVKLDDIKALALLEKQKIQLENDGYALVKSSMSMVLNLYTATYVKD